MSAKVSKEFFFLAGLHFEDMYRINSYELTVHLDVVTEIPEEQRIAISRINYLFSDCLENSVFVNTKHKAVIDNYAKAKLKVCILPDDPYDQIIAALVLQKINHITEGRLYASKIKIKSSFNDGVSFYVSDGDDHDCFHIKNAWWLNSSNSITDKIKIENKKVVEIKKEPSDWTSIGLSWKQSDEKCNGIVYIHLDK